MDESKKINAGKYRNKQRYKNKTKVVPKESDLVKNDNEHDQIVIEESSIFQKRILESNWYRYEPKQEDDKDSSRDFSVLASAPISLGSYFQFKSDKNIAAAQDIKQLDNTLFQLNVSLLNLSIGSIPFHIQCGIHERYFSKHQLDIFNREAQDSYTKFEAYLKSSKEEKCASELNEKVIQSKHIEENNFEKVTVISDNTKKSESEDLEQWLEDILDD